MANILLGISGGIAIFKVAQLVSNLSKKHQVKVIMTDNALKFMSTEVFEALTKNKVYTDVFSPYIEDEEYKISHIELAKWADVFVLAPATGNLIGKMASGIADDLLSTCLLASRSPILLCPAMNTYMLNNPAIRENLEKLIQREVNVMETESGDLACGDFGNGKLASPESIETEIERILNDNKEIKQDLAGMKILISAGPTVEAIDPVRFISNYSSGKMGYAMAKVAKSRGADVTLVSGPVNLETPGGINVLKVKSAEDMFQAIQRNLSSADALIMTAAVSDYRVKNFSESKIKKNDESLILELEKNPDILAWAGEHAEAGTVLCGFAMETENLIENAKDKLEKKGLDLIVVNSLNEQGAGFGTDTNIVTLIAKDSLEQLEIMSKAKVSDKVLDKVLSIFKNKKGE